MIPETKTDTIQFRCTPTEKYELVSAAKDSGLTLSEYVNQEVMTKKIDAFRAAELEEELQNANENQKQLVEKHEHKINALNTEIRNLLNKVSNYESKPLATNLFNKLVGQTVMYSDKNRVQVKKTIGSIQDVYAIVNSIIK